MHQDTKYALRVAKYARGGGKRRTGSVTVAPQESGVEEKPYYMRPYEDLTEEEKQNFHEHYYHSTSPEAGISTTTPPSEPTPKTPKYAIPEEDYLRGNMGEGEYALAGGGSVDRKGYALGGEPTALTPGSNPATPTPNPYQSYVNSLYQNVMGRAADESGQQYWTNQLSSGAQSTQDVLNQFAGSKEFQNLYSTNPTQAVSNLYQTALGRAPEQGGLDYWTQQAKGGYNPTAYQQAQDKYNTGLQDYNQQMANYNNQKNAYDVAKLAYDLYGNPAVKSMAVPVAPQISAPVAPTQDQFNTSPLSASQLLSQFQTAPEFKLRDAVLNSYINYTGEAPSAEQYASAQKALSQGKTLTDVTGDISQSPKAIANLVNTGYKELLNRPAESSALNYWSNQLSKGTLTPSQFLENLAKSSEGVEFANEQKVDGLYNELFGRSPDKKEISDPNSRYNDFLSKMAAGTITENQMRGELSKDLEAINYDNTQLVKNMFSDLTGRNPPQPILDDYISKLGEGSIDFDKLYDAISSTPESKDYIKLVEQGMPQKKAGEQAEITQNRDIFAKALDKKGITDPDLRNIMAAQVEAESRFLNVPETSYSGTANGRLKKKFPALKGMTNGEINELKQDDRAFFNKIYGNINGNQGGDDGYNFRGRGAIQLTGRANYQKYGELAGLGDALVKNPDLLYDPNVAAEVSIEFMKDMQKHHPGKTNFDKITRGVNSTSEAVAKKVKAYGELKRAKTFSVPGEGTTPPAPPGEPTPVTPGKPGPQSYLNEYNKAQEQYQAAYNDWKTKTDIATIQALQNSKGQSSALPSWWPAAPTPPNKGQFAKDAYEKAAKDYKYARDIHGLEQDTQRMIAQQNGGYFRYVDFPQLPPDPKNYGFEYSADNKNWTFTGAPPTSPGNIGDVLAQQGAGGNVVGTGQINQPIAPAPVDTGFKPAGGYDVAGANAAGDKLIADFIKAIQSNYVVKSSDAAAAGAGGGGYLGSGGGGYAGMFGTSPSAGWGSVSYMNKGGAVKKKALDLTRRLLEE